MFSTIFLASSECKHGEGELQKTLCVLAPVSKAKCTSRCYLFFYFFLVIIIFFNVERMKTQLREAFTFPCSVFSGKNPKLKCLTSWSSSSLLSHFVFFLGFSSPDLILPMTFVNMARLPGRMFFKHGRWDTRDIVASS